jgi:hypothetical protein
MDVNGWRINAEYLVGRRFEFARMASFPDLTFVAANDARDEVLAHAWDGTSSWVPVDTVAAVIAIGHLVESEHGVPFVNESATDVAARRQWNAQWTAGGN